MKKTQDIDGIEDSWSVKKVNRIRLTRLWEPEPVVVFEGEAELYTQLDRSGRVCLLGVRGRDWAEYDPRGTDRVTKNRFVAEDYMLEILS